VGSALTNTQWIEQGEWQKLTDQAKVFIQTFKQHKTA